MADYGLMQGLAEGIKSGLDSYQSARKYNDEKTMKDKLYNLQLLQSGYKQGVNENGESGLIPTPQKTAELNLNKLKQQSETEELTPDTPQANALGGLLREQLVKTHKGYKPEQINALITPHQSAKAYKEQLGLIKPEISMQSAFDAAAMRAGPLGDMANTRKDAQTEKAVNDVVNDKQLANHIQRISGANRIQSQMEAAAQGKFVDTKQLLGDINAEYTNLLTGSSNPAASKQEQTSYRTAAEGLSGMLQQLSANPQSINSPGIMKQLAAQVEDLKGNYQDALEIRGKSLKRTYPHNSDATKAQSDKVDELISTYGRNSKKMDQSKTPKVGDVEDGHVFLGGNPADPKSWKAQ